jgi:hypothetical protein
LVGDLRNVFGKQAKTGAIVMIQFYFLSIRNYISLFNHIIEEQLISEKSYSDTKGYIEGKIAFIDDSILEFSEVKDADFKSKIKYRYHYMSLNNVLLFRYDNAKHFPELSTFPHHKHLPQNTIESEEPEIEEILMEIESVILKKEQ